jgi:hypothetical protein
LQADKACGRPLSLHDVPDERCSQRHSGEPATWDGNLQDTKTTNSVQVAALPRQSANAPQPPRTAVTRP